MEHSTTLKTYLNYPIQNVPRENLVKIINELVASAEINMGSSGITNEIVIQAIPDILMKQYGLMPVSKLVEAIWKGSLGELGGTSKLSIRNINIWTRAIYEVWSVDEIKLRSRKERELQKKEGKVDPHLAAAFALKMYWRLDQKITPEQSDQINTREIYEKLKSGTKSDDLYPDMFLTHTIFP